MIKKSTFIEKLNYFFAMKKGLNNYLKEKRQGFILTLYKISIFYKKKF